MVELDSKSDTNIPPSYDESASPVGVLKSAKSQSKWSRILLRKNCATVLSRIRDLVASPDFTPSSVTPIVNSCAAALSPAEFSDLLQSLNIEGHTVLYWAIVNGRPEALWAFIGFISEMSSVCSSDLRLACKVTGDQRMFMQLNLGHSVGADDEPLRRPLRCPPDEVEVDEGNGLCANHKFTVFFRFRMCQKRLRIIQKLGTEFVAAGRIWFLHIFLSPEGLWCVQLGLSLHSLPARPEAATLVVEAHHDTEKPASKTGRAQAIQRKFEVGDCKLLVPEKYLPYAIGQFVGLNVNLGDWMMDNNTIYLDRDGTLHLKLEMTLK